MQVLWCFTSKGSAMVNSVLVVAAHPDDEVLGCGATMARHRAEGARVTVLVLADGVGARDPADRAKELAARQAAARRACGELGVTDLSLLAYPDNRMDQVALLDIVQDIEKIVRECQPDIVYTHHAGDVNIDHRRVHDAVAAACRPLPGFCVRQLLFFETPSSTEWRPAASFPPFAPDWFVDVSDYLPQKLAALAAYGDEMRAFPHPRSAEAVTHLAGWRGATVGVAAAEAFELGRAII
jgi:LmbE family N-acetylglucosaminyl deacetylase